MKRFVFLISAMLLLVVNSFGTLPTPPYSYPSNNVVNQSSIMGFKVEQVSSATLYEFQFADNLSFNSAITYSTTELQIVVDSFRFGLQYYWRVRCKNSNDSSLWTIPRTFKVANKMALDKPANNGVYVDGKISFSVKNFGAHEFIIQIDTMSTLSSGYLRTLYFTDLADTTIQATISKFLVDTVYFGQAYYWRATAYLGSDTLDWSDTWKVTLADSVTIIGPSDKDHDEAPTNCTLLVDKASNMKYYEYELDTTPNFNSPLMLRDTAQSGGLYVTLLKFDTRYWWRVRGISNFDTTKWMQETYLTDGINGSNLNITTTPISPKTGIRIHEVKYADSVEVEFDTTLNFNSPLKIKVVLVIDSNVNPYNYYDTVGYLRFGENYWVRGRAIATHDTSDWKVFLGGGNIHVIDHPLMNYPYNGYNNVPLDTLLWWQSSNLGVDFYRIQMDTTINFNSPLIDVTKPYKLGNDSTPVSLRFNTTYYWRAMCWNQYDTSEWSEVAYNLGVFHTVVYPSLKNPDNNTSILQSVALNLDWEDMTGAEKFHIQLDTSGSFNSGLLMDAIVNADSSYFTVSQLRFGYTYSWRVRVENTDDTSEWSNTWQFKTREKVDLQSPGNNSMVSLLKPELDFSQIEGTTGYQLQLDKVADLSNTAIITGVVDNPFFHAVDEALDFDSSYWWRVRVFHEKDTSEWSDTWKFTTRSRNAPNLVSPADKSTNQPLGLDLDWDQFSGANNYLVQLSLKSDMSDSTEYKVFTSKQAVSLRPDTIYYWRIQAYNMNDTAIGDWTEVWSFSTADSFDKVNLTYPSHQEAGLSTAIIFKWDSVQGASYEFEISVNPNMSGSDSRSTDTNQLNYSDLSINTTYYWRVRAKNNYAYGPWSDVFAFNTNTDGITTLEKSPIRVYPNPSSGVFNIKTENSEQGLIEIYNSINQIVYKASITDTELSVDISKQPVGIYFVRYKAGTKSYTLKIIKE